MRSHSLTVVIILSVLILLVQTDSAMGLNILFDAGISFGVGDNPYSVTAEDFDGDGDSDIAVANSGSNNVSILLGNGDGTFSSAVNYTAGYGPSSVAEEDLDGDGDSDIAVANYISDNVSILLGNGDGTFSSAVNYSAGDRPFSITAEDFDGDGDSDLAVANPISDNVSILLGNGDGTFSSAVNYSAGDSPRSITAEDLDGDGDSDLAVANFYSDNVSILFGNGDGTFSSAVNYSVGDSPYSVTSEDFDGDGDSDLAVANSNSDNVSILLGNGDGTFSSTVNYSAGDAPISVTAEDLDGDGDSDLAVANSVSDNVSILLGNGDGTFSSAVNYTAGYGPFSITAEDFDGDGDSDLAVANSGSDNVSILLNLSDRPPLPIISSITDIPNDQGKQVRLTWNRCGPDRPGSSVTIKEYMIYRKIDYILSASGELNGNIIEEFEKKKGRTVLLYPPGDWDYLMSVPACAETEYSVVTSTLADSTISDGMYYSTFFIRALATTPGVFYDSAPDSGYSVDNLEPSAPGTFAVAYNLGSGNDLSWEECQDEDFKCYNIYRGEESGFEPDEQSLIHSTVDIQWLDTADDGWKYHYKIASLDFSGNESDPKSPDEVTGLEEPAMPTSFALHQNYPNPFNPITNIQFDLPVRSKVNLSIYDVKGKRVTILLDKEMTAGRKSISWNGISNSGQAVASGMYFYRISTGEFVETKKMILMR